MIRIVGVRFKQVGKIYYFDPNPVENMESAQDSTNPNPVESGRETLSQDAAEPEPAEPAKPVLDQSAKSGRDSLSAGYIPKGEKVIVETSRGMECGTVELDTREVDESSIVLPLKRVIRVATDEDKQILVENKSREVEAFGICVTKIAEHGLDMKLIDTELTFDRTKITFYFASDGRVDFRELVKDLAAIFRMRIELRQIGVRDEAKMLSGIGICGRSLCCATFLSDFQPVSIKMAKEQNLPLNPTKISGICGRLMCCLKYEESTYEYLNRNLPNEGDIIRTPDGEGEVLSVIVLRQLIKAAVRKKNQDVPVIGFYNVKEIKVLTRKRTSDAGKEDIDMNELKKIMD